MKNQFLLAVFMSAFLLVLGQPDQARADDEKFEITSFDVRGNTLLPPDEVTKAVAPFTGKDREYGDVQRALEALEASYRSKGFGTVTVFVPEQELKGGVVVLQVTESVIGKVTVTGNEHFSTENVRASLPLLKEGAAPNLSAIADNIQLANENPSKHVDLTLGVSQEEGKVDAKVAVADESSRRVYFSMDNTGDKEQTGQYRLGVSYRDSNLFGHDEVMTLGYITAPDAPDGVNVDVYSVGLRLPFYTLGDSLDLIAASSSVNMPSNVVTPGSVGGAGGLALAGKGNIFALRWNHLFTRDGEYSSRLIYGADYKWTANSCRPMVVGAGCVAYLETPLSATYLGQWQTTNVAADFNLGAAYNPTTFSHEDNYRYNYASNARPTEGNYTILKGGGNYLRSLPGDWQVRGALAAQFTANPVPTADQLNLTGATAVRGFGERVLTADNGYVANFEGYTPDLAPIIGNWAKHEFAGTLRALVFYDVGYGRSEGDSATTWYDPYNKIVVPAGPKAINQSTTISSFGLGARYSLRKDFSAKFDWARVLETSPTTQLTPGDPADDLWRVHFAVIYGF